MPNAVEFSPLRLRQARATTPTPMTVQELADAVGVSRQAWYKWESGEAYPTANNLPRIAAALGVQLDDLFDEVN